MKPFSLSIHIFRRDLRLADNTALIQALNESQLVLPIFIFDNRQTENPFKGNNSFQFMINSLLELNEELKTKGSALHLFQGLPIQVLTEICKQYTVDAIFINRDYTPFSIKRDEEIHQFCNANNIELKAYADALLTEPEMVHKKDGTPYSIFTPFKNKARLIPISEPQKNSNSNYFQGNIKLQSSISQPLSLLKSTNTLLRLKGGRTEALQLLDGIDSITNYNETRDIPSVKGTSILSAHHKFGTISIRETYSQITHHFGKDHTMISELYWRDFFTHIAYHFPHVFKSAFRTKYNDIQWEKNQKPFNSWCQGQTGFPIIDAGIRELTTTGFMHNRVRMITASFLVKDLHIDWHWGERFFANHLIDYDPSVNNGNWQWAASTGCDAQPYFRIFNPWNQQKKFDPDCKYIKKWIPELKEHSPKAIHNHHKQTIEGYLAPITDHSIAASKAKQLFKTLS